MAKQKKGKHSARAGQPRRHSGDERTNTDGRQARNQGSKPNRRRSPENKSGMGRKAVSKRTSSPNRKPSSAHKPAGHVARKPVRQPKADPKSLCAVSHLCGACDAIDTPYDQQLQAKQAEMIELFDDLANEECALHPICGMTEPFHYRNKVASPFAAGRKLKGGAGKQANGTGKNAGSKPSGKQNGHASGNAKASGKRGIGHEVLCGMYAKGTHRIIDSSCCLLENEDAKKVIRTIKLLMPKFGIEPYNEDTGAGFLRHAIVRVGHESGEMLVTLVTNGAQFPASKAFCRELVKRVPAVTTVVQNVNTRFTNVILGDEGEHTLFGPGFILDDLCGLRFRISSHSFYQVNATQTEVLYRRAIELAQLTGSEVVMDAYCGTGTIGLVAAKGIDGTAGAAKVIGVERVADAVKDARNNARHNGITNAEFFAEDAGEFMQRLAREDGHIDVLFMDPPRAGSSLEFLEATCTLKPQRIVYISCGPNTQERDVRYLTKHGYRLTDIQPVDMFPHTNHTENICRLELET